MWFKACDSEIAAMVANNTWELVEPPPDQPIIHVYGYFASKEMMMALLLNTRAASVPVEIIKPMVSIMMLHIVLSLDLNHFVCYLS